LHQVRDGELARAARAELLLDELRERIEEAVHGLLVEARPLGERRDDLRLRQLRTRHLAHLPASLGNARAHLITSGGGSFKGNSADATRASAALARSPP